MQTCSAHLLSRRLLISSGAVAAGMIATNGDEVVMLAMFPKEAELLTAILFVVGIVAGWLVGCTALHQLAGGGI